MLKGGQLFVKKHPDEIDFTDSKEIFSGITYSVYDRQYRKVDGYVKTLKNKKESVQKYLDIVTIGCGEEYSRHIENVWISKQIISWK